jgi:hypothetical protein
MNLLFGFRRTSVMIMMMRLKKRNRKEKKHRPMLLLLMLWNNITSLHTAVKTISSSILAEIEKKKILR